MISSIDSPINIDYNNNRINNNVVQVNSNTPKLYYSAGSGFFGTVVQISATNQLLGPGRSINNFEIAGENMTVETYSLVNDSDKNIIYNVLTIYLTLLKQIDKKYKTSLVLNLANYRNFSYQRQGNNIRIDFYVSINPYYDYATINRYNNFNFARKMFTAAGNFDSVGVVPTSNIINFQFRFVPSASTIFPYDLGSPLLTLFNQSLNDLKNNYSNELLHGFLSIEMFLAIYASNFFNGGTGTITQAEFNALLSTSNLSSLNDTYLKKKNYLTVNGGETSRNRYIGRYAVLETTANFILNIGAVEIDKANFPVNTSKSTDSTFFVTDPSITYKLTAGVYNVTIRLEFTATGTNSSPIVFFQFSTSPTIQGLQTAESNSSINKPSTQIKNSGGDADVSYSERVLSLSVDSFMYITAYTSVGNTTFYAGQCQIIIQKIAENS